MLKSRLAPLVAIAVSAAIGLAQEPATSVASKPDESKAKSLSSKPAPVNPAPTRQQRVAAKPTPVPVATPIPKKPGFWERVFGKKKPTPAPATPTPTPAKPKKKARKPKPVVTETSPGDASTTASTTGQPNEENKDATTEERPKPPVAKSGKQKKGEKIQDSPPTTDNADAEQVEKQKYDEAKAKAVADPKIQELRGKADLAATEDESRKALRAYNKAMFKRMKEIDPSIKDHIESMEAAVMSRLGE